MEKTPHAELSPEARLLHQFTRLARIGMVPAALALLGLYFIDRSINTLGLAVFMGLVMVPLFAYAGRMSRYNQVERPMIMISISIWVFSLWIGADPLVFGAALLLAISPILLGVPFASSRLLLKIIIVSVAVCAIEGVIYAFDYKLYTDNTPDEAARAFAAVFAPFIAGVGSLAMWHVSRRLSGNLSAMREANLKLAENERLLESKVEKRTADLKIAAEEAAALHEVARTVNSTPDFDRVMARVMTAMQRLFPFDLMSVVLLDEERQHLCLEHGVGRGITPEVLARYRESKIPMDEVTSGIVHVVKTGKPFFVGDVSPEIVAMMSPSDRRVHEISGAKSLLFCPMEIENEVFGAILFGSTRERFSLTEGDIRLIRRYVTQLSAGIRNARYYEEAKAARTAAVEATQAKSNFLASMSHELRTPLNAIIGYSEILQEEARDDGNEEYLPDLDKILSSGRYLLTLINGVLDLSKIEAGKMEVYLEDCDVAETVRGVQGTVKPMVSKNDNTLEIGSLEGLGTMHCDLTKLRQMLFNLLSNASKFTKNGTINLDVTRQSEDGEDWLHFRITDTGIGMNEEQLGKVFEEFSQAESSTTKEYGGTGLGLPITKKFCEMLGGRIDVTSAPGKGACFEIHLPARAPRAAAQDVETAPSAGLGTSASLRDGTTVLVIDDDPAALDLISRFLKGEGYRVITAAGGEEGLRLAREHHPDLITLDVLMPHMDGWAVLSSLKTDPALADIPVILVTMTDDRSMGYTLGASGFLTKPIDRDQLGALLRKYAPSDNAGATALIVDDDPAIRDMMRRGVEGAGWKVVEAKNGREAIERVAKAVPDLILLDLMMPEMDGFECVDRLRANEAWRKIPVLIVTAKDITAEDRARLEGSVVRILEKSSDTQQKLLDEVRSLVGSRAPGRVPA